MSVLVNAFLQYVVILIPAQCGRSIIAYSDIARFVLATNALLGSAWAVFITVLVEV